MQYRITLTWTGDVAEAVARMEGLLPSAGLEVRSVNRVITIKTPLLADTLEALAEEFEDVERVRVSRENGGFFVVTFEASR